jgi:hypothetical protein
MNGQEGYARNGESGNHRGQFSMAQGTFGLQNGYDSEFPLYPGAATSFSRPMGLSEISLHDRNRIIGSATREDLERANNPTIHALVRAIRDLEEREVLLRQSLESQRYTLHYFGLFFPICLTLR